MPLDPECACEITREALEEVGFSMDLGLVGLGNGKLIVRADLAKRTITALGWRCRMKGSLLTSSDIVVSSEYKSVILEEVRRQAPRVNPVAWTEPLDLGPNIETKHTFLEPLASGSSGTEICSSTDARLGICDNPRKKARKAMQ